MFGTVRDLPAGGVYACVTPYKRIMDMLPALIVFAIVSAFATYVAFAFVLQDPWWLQTVAELRRQAAGD